MKNKNLLKVVYAALFAALVFAGTQFIRVPLPFGYFNFGDFFVLICAVIIGGPYAVIASAIGSGLADVLSGYAIYAPATIIIKSLMVICMIAILKIGKDKSKTTKILTFALGAVAAEIVMVGGYFVYDTILYSLAGSVASLTGNLLQGAVALVSSTLVIAVLESSGIIKRIKLSQ